MRVVLRIYSILCSHNKNLSTLVWAAPDMKFRRNKPKAAALSLGMDGLSVQQGCSSVAGCVFALNVLPLGVGLRCQSEGSHRPSWLSFAGRDARAAIEDLL